MSDKTRALEAVALLEDVLERVYILLDVNNPYHKDVMARIDSGCWDAGSTIRAALDRGQRPTDPEEDRDHAP